ncbi:MAG: Flp family type IVb pilin [Pseudomonadota bacterium]|mgnify:CR=1
MVLTKFLKHIGSDSQGATAVEYGLIVSLVVIAMLGALQAVANANSNQWSAVETKATDAMSGN